MAHDNPFTKDELVRNLPALRGFARSMVRDAERADDLVQEAVLKAWAKRHQFQKGTNLEAWLFTILRNHFHSQLRKAAREVEDVDGIMASKIAVGPSQEGVVMISRLSQALDELSADYREAIILVGARGLSYEEAANICGCAIGTMKSRVNRARRQLSEKLGVTGPGDLSGSDSISSAIAGAA